MIDSKLTLSFRDNRRAVRTDSSPAFPLRNLNDRAADSAARAGGEDSFSRLETGDFDQPNPCGYEIHTHHGGFLEAQVFRLRAHSTDRHDQQFCLCTVARESDIAAGAPHFRSDHVGGPVDDDSCEVAARRARKGCPFHAAENVLGVTRAQGCRANADEDFARFRLRIGHAFDLQFLETAELVKAERLHLTHPSSAGRAKSLGPKTELHFKPCSRPAVRVDDGVVGSRCCSKSLARLSLKRCEVSRL